MDKNSLPYLKSIDLSKRILEIGPLMDPIVPKSEEAPFVYYADIRSTKDIIEIYRHDPNVDRKQIVGIDFVVSESYSKTFRDVEPFDYIIMRHVIEHVPQLILFFQDVSTALRDGGKLLLTIPDARFSFDHCRTPTSFAELYDIYKRGDGISAARVLDSILCVDMSSNIEDQPDLLTNYLHVPNGHGTANVAIQAYNAAIEGEKFDVHFGVFSPATFLLNTYYMTEAGLFPYEVSEYYVPDGFSIEFHATLTKNESIQNVKEEQDSHLKKIAQRLAEINEDQSKVFDPQRNNAMLDHISYLSRELSLMANSFSWKSTGWIRKLAKRARK